MDRIMTEEVKTETITPCARYYRLHRDEQLAKKKEEYNNRPDVIVKREEREAKTAQKEAEKAAKQAEKDKKIQESVALAEQTKRKLKTKSEQNLNSFLKADSPA